MIPLLLFLSARIDSIVGFSHPFPETYGITLSFILILTGLIFIFLSGYAQLKTGRGTPIPAVPTQKLVTSGVYALCRNPMLFGSILYYLGIFSTVYIKLVEEKNSLQDSERNMKITEGRHLLSFLTSEAYPPPKSKNHPSQVYKRNNETDPCTFTCKSFVLKQHPCENIIACPPDFGQNIEVTE